MSRVCMCGCGETIANDKWQYKRGHKSASGDTPPRTALAKREPNVVIEEPEAGPEMTVTCDIPVRLLDRMFGGLSPYQKAVAVLTGLDAEEAVLDGE